jgi:hypothetical protein
MTTKPRAPVALLSLAKRTALIECFNNNGLDKRSGCWCGAPEGKHIAVSQSQISLAMACSL